MSEYIMQCTTDMDGVDCYVRTGVLIRCKDCKHMEEHHYEDEGQPPIIKYTCANKVGLAKGYQVHEWDFCSRAERRQDEQT